MLIVLAKRHTQPKPGICILGVQFDGFAKIFDSQLDAAAESWGQIVVPYPVAEVIDGRFRI